MKPGYVGASIAGVVFGIAWWVFISACVSANKNSKTKVEFVDALPVTGVTIGFLLLVTFDWAYLEAVDEEYTTKCTNIAAWARILLFFVIMIGFGSLVGSAILLAVKWAKLDVLYGVLQLVTTILIFVSALIWRTARNLTLDY